MKMQFKNILEAIMQECISPFQLEKSWEEELKDELSRPYMNQLASFLEKERNAGIRVYPPQEQIFNAFLQTPFPRVKVVIMGQDPYHGKGQAHGLSFSVSRTVVPPPSLKNIYKELHSDLGILPADHGNLLAWAKQGVLLLNATLTVREGEPKSHFGYGWEKFTDAVIQRLCLRQDPLVFLLWGKSAHDKCTQFLQNPASKHHLVLTAPHPSPYSASSGFFGCRHFSKANEFLVAQGKAPIDWLLS
jgi:uracil-DNA glycosylase